jgi:MSHA type pilus biogenesis protein MshL
MHWKHGLVVAAIAAALAGCAQPAFKPSDTHLGMQQPKAQPEGAIPAPVQVAPVLPKPTPKQEPETYSVVVNGVPAQELLFALARDARLNIDVAPGIAGSVTLNAVDQTLRQLLDRIARQVDIRYELNGPNLVVMPDSPFLRVYRVDFVTASRNVKMKSETNTQFSGGASSSTGSGSGANTTGTGTTTTVDLAANTQLWDTLVQNIQDIIGQSANAGGAAAKPAAVATTAGVQAPSSVIGNRESGVLYVRATSRQQARVAEFLDTVMANVRRQVLIEATVAEVQLNNQYQRGIDWQRLRTGATTTGVPAFGTGQSGVEFSQSSLNTPANISTNAFELGGAILSQNFNVAIKLLESFGDVRVLSSPKVSVLNNQAALLRVTRDIVYFTVKPAQTTTGTGSGTTIVEPSFETTPNVAAEGFMMSVLPQISQTETVVLNVRPTIRRKVDDAIDPNPALTTPNLIPVFETREFDSILRIQSGQTAVLGGLMQDSVEKVDDGIPGLNQIPFFGKLFSQERKVTRKTELVIFLRATVIHDASLDGDYAKFREMLPEKDFLTKPRGVPEGVSAPTVGQ